MRTVVWLSEEVLDTLKPDTSDCISLMSRAPLSCSSCSGSTLMVIGTSCSASSRFCAVTISASRVVAWRSPEAGASCAEAAVARLASAAATDQASMLRCVLSRFMDLPSQADWMWNPSRRPTHCWRRAGAPVCAASRDRLPPLPSSGVRRRVAPVLPQVFIGTAHAQLEGQQPTEAVADVEFVGHAHAAMQLHRLLPDPARGLADQRLGAGHGLAARMRVVLQAGRGGEQAHRTRLLDLHVHVG